MALSDLILRLEQEAQSQIDAIERDAAAQVRGIEEATGRAVDDVTGRHLELERAERQSIRERELVAARRAARARVLHAQHLQLSRILARARDLAPEAAASEVYSRALPSHVDEALLFLDGLQPRVRCSARWTPVVEGAVARHHGARVVVDESVEAGIVAEAPDGSVLVDNTLAARLTRAEARLRIELLRRLDDACA